MKIKRKAVPNKDAKDIPMEASPALGTEHLYSCEVLTATSVAHLGATHIADHGTLLVLFVVGSSSVQSKFATSSTFRATAAALISIYVSAMEIHEEGGDNGAVNAAEVLHRNEPPSLVHDFPCRIDISAGVPVQVSTIDGSMSTFQAADIARPFYAADRQSEMNGGLFAIQMLIS